MIRQRQGCGVSLVYCVRVGNPVDAMGRMGASMTGRSHYPHENTGASPRTPSLCRPMMPLSAASESSPPGGASQFLRSQLPEVAPRGPKRPSPARVRGDATAITHPSNAPSSATKGSGSVLAARTARVSPPGHAAQNASSHRSISWK